MSRLCSFAVLQEMQSTSHKGYEVTYTGHNVQLWISLKTRLCEDRFQLRESVNIRQNDELVQPTLMIRLDHNLISATHI